MWRWLPLTSPCALLNVCAQLCCTWAAAATAAARHGAAWGICSREGRLLLQKAGWLVAHYNAPCSPTVFDTLPKVGRGGCASNHVSRLFLHAASVATASGIVALLSCFVAPRSGEECLSMDAEAYHEPQGTCVLEGWERWRNGRGGGTALPVVA